MVRTFFKSVIVLSLILMYVVVLPPSSTSLNASGCGTQFSNVIADGLNASGGSVLPYDPNVYLSWDPVAGAVDYNVLIWDTTAPGNSLNSASTYTVASSSYAGTAVLVPYGRSYSGNKRFRGQISANFPSSSGCGFVAVQIDYYVSSGGRLPQVIMSANPMTVTPPGNPSTLSWTVSNAAYCTSDNGNMPPGQTSWQTGGSGSGVVHPIITETWGLRCYNTTGQSAHDSVTITVDDPALVGTCGTANGKDYPYSARNYGSDTQCAKGTAVPADVFPNPGFVAYWRCGLPNDSTLSDYCLAYHEPAPSCTPPPEGGGVMITPVSVLTGSQFEIRCDFGNVNDYVPAPAGCSWPGSGNPPGHQGTAVTFSCIAPSTPQNKEYTCQSYNQPSGFTNWCSPPAPITKTVSIVAQSPSCVNPSSRPAPVMTAPASAPVNSTFEITCNYGSNLDYIPAPSGCSWPGSNGGWIGSAATFSCTAPSTPQNKTYTCQSQNGGPAGSTVWCSLPNPVSKTVTVTPGTTQPSDVVTLTVLKSQGGSVSSDDGAIQCGTACNHTYTKGDRVVLTPIPDSARWRFAGWTGDCTGTGSCSLIMDTSKTVFARFSVRPLIYEEF